MMRAPLARLYRTARLALLAAIALLLAAIYAKLPDRAPTVGELRAAAGAKRGPDMPDVLARVPLVRVESGEVTVDRVNEPVQIDGPVEVAEPVEVTVDR